MTPRVEHAERDGVSLAYELSGSGTGDLLVIHDFAGHLELDWQLPGARRLFERLDSFARVIRLDKRGTGMSARDVPVGGAEVDADDALAVLDAAGSGRCAVFAWGDGVAAALLLAVRQPERVAALVLYGGSARPPPRGASAVEAADRAAAAWGTALAPGFAAGTTNEFRERWTARATAAASPHAAFALVLTAAQSDVRADAAQVVAPTLVLHRAGDEAVPVAEGRTLAGLIPTAEYVELPGDAHLPYVDPDEIADEVEAFVGRAASADRRESIGPYELEQELDRGGMGTVHVAFDRRLRRRVALKLLPRELTADEHFRTRFLREQRLAASLAHPAIVPIYDAGEVAGRLYLAMRFVDGTDLRRLIASEAPLDPSRIVRIVSRVAEALDVAHARGLVHRDVKPANILLDDDGRAYLCDFGLTKEASDVPAATRRAPLVGTIDYVAPEQIRGEEGDGRADVYSLGCVLHEGLTGRPPHGGGNETQTLWGHLQEEPVPPSQRRPDLPAGLDDVVARALAKEPADRFSTAGELAAAAREAVGLEPTFAARARRPARAAVVLGAALLAAAVAAAVAYGVMRGGAAPASRGIVAALDVRSGRTLAEIHVGSDPTDVVYADGGVWAASAAGRTVARIDARSRRVARVFTVAFAPGSVAASRRSVWVGGYATNRVVELDATSGTVLRRLMLPPSARTFGLAADGNRVFVAAGDAGIVLAGTRTPRTVPLAAAVDVAVGEGAAWALTPTTLVRLSRRDPRPTGRVAVPDALAAAAGAGAVWVTRFGGLARIDPRSLNVGPAIDVADGPVSRATPVAIAAGAGAVWVALLDGTVVRIAPRTSRVIARVHVAGTPAALAVGGGLLWVALQPRDRT
jgi:pimeloyl-ACP methyl ester carboxylesterase